MNWLKQSAIDLLVTGVILFSTFQHLHTLDILLAIYTAFLLFIKLFGLWHEGLLKRMKNGAAAPEWLYHLLYAANVAALAASQRWMMGLVWLVIWLVSWQTARKLRNLASPLSTRPR